MSRKSIWRRSIATFSIAAALLISANAPSMAQNFGDATSIAYAQKVWGLLKNVGLADSSGIVAIPYEGTEPHGFQLETFMTRLNIDGTERLVIVKRNYGPEGVEPEEVLADPAKHLAAVTIMVKREAGYDSDNQDWFWAKYLPDGSLDKNPKGMQLAGRVAKGADAGCIACHMNAPGEDYSFKFELK